MWSVIAGLAILLYTLKNTEREIAQEVFDVVHQKSFDHLYVKIGKKYNLDPELLKAHAIVESNENPMAKGPTNDYGLMQIVYPQNLPAVINWDQATPERLLNDPEYNIDVAAQIMKWNHKNYGWDKAIAIYNAWGARKDPDYGPFRNQEYVNKVNTAYRRLLSSTNFNQDNALGWKEW